MYREPRFSNQRPQRDPEDREFSLGRFISSVVGIVIMLMVLRSCLFVSYQPYGGGYYGGGSGIGSFVSGFFLGNMFNNFRSGSSLGSGYQYSIPQNSYTSPSNRSGSWGSSRGFGGGGFRFGK